MIPSGDFIKIFAAAAGLWAAGYCIGVIRAWVRKIQAAV